MSKVLFVIANNNFQDAEFKIPKDVLEKANIQVDVAAGKKGECIGKFGTKTQATLSLSEASCADYDAVVFIGGPGAYNEYQNNKEYFSLAKLAKILGAICIAPTILSDSGIFKNKKVTGWDDGEGTQKKHIEKNGATFTGEDITTDGNIITANGPSSAEKFGQAILSKL
ncbi:MAG: DJ-1/PfpI family protein [Candidatus Gracilibacteria bacterium]|jgi:protease I